MLVVMSDNKKLLELFCQKAMDLRNSSAFQIGKVRFTLEVKTGEGGSQKLTHEGPQKESIIALVTTLRQFYQQGESINFFRICNIVYRHVNSYNSSEKKEHFEYIQSAREAFNNTLNHCPIQLKINDHELTPRELIELWFNGNIFHADIEKSDKFDSLMKMPLADFAELVFKATVISLASIIVSFADFISAEVLTVNKTDSSN
jgi:hypothetical protein